MCDFQVKIDLAKAAGYTSVIVFNRTGADGCETLVNMLAVDRHPGDLRVAHGRLPDPRRRPGCRYTCERPRRPRHAPRRAGPAVPVNMAAQLRRLGLHAPLQDRPRREGAKLPEVGIYAPAENQSEAFAEGYGDISVHEVADGSRRAT